MGNPGGGYDIFSFYNSTTGKKYQVLGIESIDNESMMNYNL